MPVQAYKLYDDGLVICGDFGSPHVDELIDAQYMGNAKDWARFPLIISDPPYGHITVEPWDLETYAVQTRLYQDRLTPGGSAYVWGGIGKPKDRPFLEWVATLEKTSRLTLQNLITWSKKRAYGKADNYLFTREECAWLTLGPKPARFQIPLLSTKRGYAGYNAKYPAKSEYLRRTNVWTDITELFRGKIHPTQKPDSLFEIPILVHTLPDDVVLDPYAGSGTTARACRLHGRRFCLVERDRESYETILRSLDSFPAARRV